jgi:ubiquinone/menaquinone biosynthesis C-methylase UbiE
MQFFASNDRSHWETVYQTHKPDEVSWFQAEPRLSLELIRSAAPSGRSRIIDVGGGPSRLVDGLLASGFIDLTVLDLSPTALAQARERLGAMAARVLWVEADALTDTLPPASFDVWHDRAVFHFLTTPSDRRRYVEQVRRVVRPGGHVLVATFADDGPTHCSGLPVERYGATTLHGKFGADFRVVSSQREEHVTPAGKHQPFIYCLCTFEPPATGHRAA